LVTNQARWLHVEHAISKTRQGAASHPLIKQT
jgi:hypothetical protein